MQMTPRLIKYICMLNKTILMRDFYTKRCRNTIYLLFHQEIPYTVTKKYLYHY